MLSPSQPGDCEPDPDRNWITDRIKSPIASEILPRREE